MLDIIYISLMFLSAGFGLLLVRKNWMIQYKLLVFFLVVSCINELVCYFLKKRLINTLVNYNFYYYFRFVLLAFIYSKFYPAFSTVGYTIRAFYVLSAVMFLLNIYLYDGFFSLHTTYLTAGSLFVIILCLIRFYSILASDKRDSPFRYPFFWVSTGLFFYFLMIIPFLGVINFLSSKDMILASQKLVIIKVMSFFLYLLISADFYVQWRKMKLKY